MPSRWHLLLGVRPQHVHLHHLHAALSRFMRHRDDGITDFSLCPPQDGPEGSCRIEMRLLNDSREVVDRLVEGLGDASSSSIFLGPRNKQRRIPVLRPIGAVSMGPLSLVEALSWAELWSSAPAIRSFTMHFESPTFFRRGNRQMVLPVGSSVISSLHRQWAAHAPSFDVARLSREAEIVVDHLSGETVTVVLDQVRWTGFIGQVRYSLDSGTSADAQNLGRMLSAASFTGVGSMVAYGFGVVDVTV